jgi:aminocarboxymuconate-semialdehyde decarboxylase
MSKTLESQLFSIDVHTHILPKNIPDYSEKFGYGEFVS